MVPFGGVPSAGGQMGQMFGGVPPWLMGALLSQSQTPRTNQVGNPISNPAPQIPSNPTQAPMLSYMPNIPTNLQMLPGLASQLGGNQNGSGGGLLGLLGGGGGSSGMGSLFGGGSSGSSFSGIIPQLMGLFGSGAGSGTAAAWASPALSSYGADLSAALGG